MAFKAFANDTDVVNVQGDALTITNDPARIVLTGVLTLTRDQAGLNAALTLQQAVNSIVDALQKAGTLPDHLAEDVAKPTGTVKNPFV